MEGEIWFLAELAIILAAANIGGLISKKLGQPAVLGQILAGLLMGPTVFGLLHETEFIKHMAEIGVILLMFIAGLETDLDDLKASGKSSSLIALGGVIMPLLFGTGVVYLLKPEAGLSGSLFVGVILTATSVSITVQTLRELGTLRSKQGIAILGAAIIDDVAGIIMLTLVMGMAVGGGANIFIVIGKIVAFFIISLFLGVFFSKLLSKHKDKLSGENQILTYALIFCFILAFIAEELSVAAIIGAYFTGVIFSTTPHRNRVSHEVQNVANAVFVPIFFINIGLGVEINSIGSALTISIAIIIAAVLGKVIGCGFGAKLSGFDTKEAMQISVGMVPRAEVALIITNLGLKKGVIGQDIFTAIILLVLFSTIFTPIMLKILNDDKKDKKLKVA